jgi:hypothetical protein
MPKIRYGICRVCKKKVTKDEGHHLIFKVGPRGASKRGKWYHWDCYDPGYVEKVESILNAK